MSSRRSRCYFCSPYHQDSALFPFIDQLGRAAGFWMLITQLRSSSRSSRPRWPAPRRLKRISCFSLIAVIAEIQAPSTAGPQCAAEERADTGSPNPAARRSCTPAAGNHGLRGCASDRPNLARPPRLHCRASAQPASPHRRDVPPAIRAAGRPAAGDVADVIVLIGGTVLPWSSKSPAARPFPTMSSSRSSIARTVAAALYRGINQERAGERALLREEAVLLRARPHVAAICDPDDIAGLADGTARPLGVGAAGGTDWRGDRAGVLTRDRMPSPVLTRTSDNSCSTASLLRELVFQRGAPPEAVYTFKHALVQDAADSSLLRGSRQQLHAQIANALETDFPELMESQPELFALHYTEAGFVEIVEYRRGRSQVSCPFGDGGSGRAIAKGLDQLALLPDARTLAPGAGVLERFGRGIAIRQRSGDAGKWARRLRPSTVTLGSNSVLPQNSFTFPMGRCSITRSSAN